MVTRSIIQLLSAGVLVRTSAGPLYSYIWGTLHHYTHGCGNANCETAQTLSAQMYDIYDMQTVIETRCAIFVDVPSMCVNPFYNSSYHFFQGGIYVFYMYDNYAAAGWCVLFVAICECVTVSWLFGMDRFWNVITDMLRYSPRIPWFKYAWAYVSPILTLVRYLSLFKRITSYTILLTFRLYLSTILFNIPHWLTTRNTYTQCGLKWCVGDSRYHR